MADQKYEALRIDVGGTKLPYERAIIPSKLDQPDIDLDKEAQKVNDQIDDYCAMIAEISYVASNEKEKLFKRLLDVRKDIIDSKDEQKKIDRELILSDANFEIHRVHADIAKQQMAWEEQLELARKSELSPRVQILGVVFTVIIIVLIVLGWETDVAINEMPVVGIPLSVILWSAIGSLAAILYRFYKLEIRKFEQVELEVRWLIGRPLIGIIMGMMSYLIIISGLFLFGSATPLGDQSTKPQLLWVAAFLAGFSDKFWEGLIDKIVGRAPLTDE